ncbi:hypothetical protein RR46_13002 [Papilio xuthus]|uniref:Uncharacterized protein n=1 Tax=Papilio xuthus TaxID=66420 RepID=A0A194PKI3_PAPXU|nr:hypothetical protein RR46_13002 [Papilio xuthus]
MLRCAGVDERFGGRDATDVRMRSPASGSRNGAVREGRGFLCGPGRSAVRCDGRAAGARWRGPAAHVRRAQSPGRCGRWARRGAGRRPAPAPPHPAASPLLQYAQFHYHTTFVHRRSGRSLFVSQPAI